MKKLFIFSISILSVFLFSCKNKKSSSYDLQTPELINSGDSSQDRVYDAGNFFTPDYTPYIPEAESKAGKLKLSSPSAKKSKAENIIPGLRKLSDYKTSYSTEKKDFKIPEVKRKDSQSNGKKSVNNNEPLTVIDWGPQGVIPAEVRFPSFYVLFSEPVVAMAALNQQVDAREYVKITPEIKGTFRWNGTSLLSFDTSEAVDPMQVYTITLSDSIKSISGKSITGEKTFKTEAAPLKIIWSAPGFSKNKWVDSNEVPPEFSKEFRLQFNYSVKAEEIAKLSKVLLNEDKDSAIPFTVKQEKNDTLTYEWTKDIPYNTKVTVYVEQKLSGKENITKASFNTLSPFVFDSYREDSSYAKYTNPVIIYFSHPVKMDSVINSVKAYDDSNSEITITKDNFEVHGCSLKIYGLPLEFHSRYRIVLSKKIKDIYGRSLTIHGDDNITLSIDVPGPESKTAFTDSGVKMLESSFPHRMIFEYQNIDSGAYVLNKTDNPFMIYKNKAGEYVWSSENESSRKILSTKPRDERIFEIVNLEDKLVNGKGWVEFYSEIRIPRKPTRWDPSEYYTTSNKTSIQVTNLGVTVRYSMNKIIAMVTNLSDGKLVEGASVSASKDFTNNPKSYPTATTDKNGMAVINLDSSNVMDVISDSYWNPPYIYVEKDDDKIVYTPEDHSPWRSGIDYYSRVPNKITEIPRIFMFSDRGLYKPGETVSFRGIDRNQVLGSFIPYKGPYRITFKEDSWRNEKKYNELTGTSSESGGFYGSFTIPEDIEPGIYTIEYERLSGNKKIYQKMNINVAFFERLKFQTSISMPKTNIIAGEKIQAELNASYLSGGVLSSAQYETNWFREPWYFTSDEAEFKDYIFGPRNTSEGRSHIQEDSGALDAAGSSILSCQTSGNSIKGAPYRYRVSADVTDISNQQISTSGITMVHPASFYIGLSKPETSSAFAKKGEKVTFSYKLALPDGKSVADSKTAGLLSGENKKIAVKLTREEWTLVQQQGIDGIYSRYEKTDVEESSQSVNFSSDGKITVTPAEPGYHKIQLSTSDKQGREVITEYEFFVTGSGRSSWYQDDATSLRLTPDKNQYNPGETAHILLESSLPEGNYLITVEREGIFTEEVRHLDGSINVIDIPVARNYVPVFYVSISSYSVRQGAPKHEYGSADLDKPKGYYGATSVFVNPRVKSFTVKMESKKPSYRPGEEAEVTIYATKGGKALANAEITLMAVDRGVLDLINYHVPDPISFFYRESNFPLQVKGGDSRAYLMDPVTYEVKNLKGGDSGEDEKLKERKDFNPTAVFEPMLKTDDEGKVVCKFKLPDTLTTYRLTAFGVNGELLALQEDEIAVQNPINVQQVLPRELRERDTAEIGLLITNLDSEDHEITLSAVVEEADKAKTEENGITLKSGKAFIDGKNKHKIKVPSGANATVFFDLAAQKAGIISLNFTVKSDILNEKIVCPLKIEKPYVFETVTTVGQLSSKDDTASETIVIPSYIEDMNGSLSLTLDATRLGLLGESVKYLFAYPYGCLEQQSSKILPLVIFEDYIDVFNMDCEVSDIHKCVKSYFNSWKQCQHSDGGFGYWPNSIYSNLFVSSRIAHIYALALKRGYKAKDLGIDIDKLCSYISQEANSLKKKAELVFVSNSEQENIALYYNDYCRAYNYYVLQLNGRTVADEWLSNIIKRDGQDIAALALAGLASFEKGGSSTDLTKEAAAKIRQYMKPTTRGVDITNPKAPKSAYAYYGDSAENLALTLQLFTQIDKDDQMNTRLIHSLLNNQKAGYWKNTATTARVLEAIYNVIKTNNLDKTNLNASALLDGKELASSSFKGAGAKPITVTIPFDSEKMQKIEKDKELSLDFKKNGKGALYYTSSMTYALPQELQTARDGGIGLVMQLYDNATGEEIKINSDNPLIELDSGKTYKVKLTVSSSYDRNYLALRAPIPSGAEILDATFVTSPDAAENASGQDEYSDDYDDYYGYFYGADHYMSNQAIYNGEIQFFWDFFGKGKTTAEFKFRAVRRGVFPTPPVTSECMYESEIFGRTGGILYTIK